MAERTMGSRLKPLLLLCMALPLQAETLEDAWSLALARNAGLAAVQAEAEAARAGESAARAERWPTLAVNGSYQRFGDAPAFSFPVGGTTFTSPELVSNNDFYQARARLELPVFTAGRLTAGIESAHQSTLAAEAVSTAACQDLKLAVATAYVSVLRAQRAVDATVARATSLKSLVGDVTVMVERETVARNDLLAARVTLANAEQERLQAENRLALAIATYNRLLGEPLDRQPVLADIGSTALPDETLDALLGRAQAGRSELAGFSARARALDEQARRERASGLPQVGLMADYQHLENQVLDRQDFSLVGVGFNWTVFDAGRTRERAASFASAGRAAGRERDDLRSRIELEVHQAWLDRQEARARIPVTGEAVEQAEENLRVAKELYGAGLAINTVVLDAEALRLQAVNNHNNAGLDAALADLRLRRAVGEL